MRSKIGSSTSTGISYANEQLETSVDNETTIIAQDFSKPTTGIQFVGVLPLQFPHRE